MRLYDSYRAPNPRRVRWFLAEKGDPPVDIVNIDILAGDHRAAEYLATVGVPNVPALTMDDGTTITESIAICRYLESVFPEPNLMGRDAREIAIIEMWTRRAELTCGMPLMLAVRHSHPALAALEQQSADVAAFNLRTAERALNLFERRLKESAWIAADRVTIADGLLYVALEFARMIRFKIPEGMENLARWQETMRARPSGSAGG